MKLFVVVFCLLSERFIIHSASYQRFYWFSDYSQRISALVKGSRYFSNEWMLLAALLVPIVAGVSIIYFLLHPFFFGFGGLILNFILFYYCLGPQNPFYPLSMSQSTESNQNEVYHYFTNINSQLFSVLFWYLICGPIIALSYRLIALCRHDTQVSHCANRAADIFEWLPARITVLLFLLAGNFQKGFGCFLNHILSYPEDNNKIIAECGLLAAQHGDSETVSMSAAENLVEYSLVIFLVFIAFFTLVAWI